MQWPRPAALVDESADTGHCGARRAAGGSHRLSTMRRCARATGTGTSRTATEFAHDTSAAVGVAVCHVRPDSDLGRQAPDCMLHVLWLHFAMDGRGPPAFAGGSVIGHRDSPDACSECTCPTLALQSHRLTLAGKRSHDVTVDFEQTQLRCVLQARRQTCVVTTVLSEGSLPDSPTAARSAQQSHN